MADRVHPRDSPPLTGEHKTTSSNDTETPTKPFLPMSEKPVSPPGTYVIQIPKDQVYRVPPPENTNRYQNYTRRKTRRNPCCCCLCWLLGLITLFILLLAATAGILYLIFRPEAPKYSIDDLSINGFNLSTSSSTLSPQFDVTVRAQNPNDKIGIYYEKGSSVKVYHSNVNLCNGVLPSFYQPSNNVTVFQTALTGSGLVLTSTVHEALLQEQSQGNIPFRLKLKAPVKIKFGSVKTWTITVKVTCDITVDKLAADAKIVSKDCDVGVKLWED